MASNPIESVTLTLEPGDTFVLFSDGVTEATNTAEDFYGEERLLKVLSECADASATDIVTRVMGDVRAFAAGAKQSDDIAVLAARYAPAS
jgi:sigma-B regulation protein RsbU (phosphoserine phosphatase)